MISYTVEENGTIKKTDGEKEFLIPVDESNSDYQAYLATLASESNPTGGNN